MAISRQVTRTGKDRDGDITSLCGSFGSVAKPVAISQIESKQYEYWTNGSNRAVVYVKKHPSGRKYLTTARDETRRNNLDHLPDR